jgi:D-alanyl-D-alanine dipeptidase
MIVKTPMVIPQPEIEYASFTLADVPSGPEPFRLMNRIPIIENGEPLVDLRETNKELSFGDYCLPYVRESVAQALKSATERVPEHLDLRIFTALRTLEQQAEMYWGNYRRAREAHPEWPESIVRKMTNRFFAPPDAKAPPGHCTGGAVDVGLLLRDSGEGLDVRSPLEGWKGAPTMARGLSPEAAENRRLLCYMMHSTGLSNCRDEFWHWSYGDSAWAVRVGVGAACYGLIEPPAKASRVAGRVVVGPYDHEWPVQFESIREALLAAVGPLAVRIEHIGSTSVAGLSAKPILDINLVVENQAAMGAVIAALSEFGYDHQGDLGIAGREAFRVKRDEASKDAPCRGWPRHNLYACVADSLELRRHLAFRDHLRSNSVAAVAYAELKAQLAARHPWDIDLYGEKKRPFVSSVLREVDSRLVEEWETGGP